MTREEFNYLPDGDTLQLINDLEKQKFDLEQQYLDVKNALRLSTNHVNQLQKDKKDLIVERDDYRQQLIKVKEERDAIKKGYDVLCDRRDDLERGINEFARELADSEEEREQLKRSLAVTESERDAIKKNYDCVCEKLRDLERKLTESQTERDALKQQLENQKKSEHGYPQEAKSLAETIQRLHERIEENRKDLLAKDDELVSTRIQRDKIDDLYKNLALESSKLWEEQRQQQRDLDLFRSLVEIFVKERNSRE